MQEPGARSQVPGGPPPRPRAFTGYFVPGVPLELGVWSLELSS